jgi:pimeloyl-ACP methyl ester carboxylesterase
MASTSTALVRAAGEHLIAASDLPVQLIWSSEDEVFPLANAERYANALRYGELVRIDDSFSFTRRTGQTRWPRQSAASLGSAGTVG